MEEMCKEVITPEVAAQYLERNIGNRMMRAHRVTQYAEAMRRFQWHLTGDPLVFSRDGVLIQGQHRLAACVQAGVAFTTYVMRNADPACYGVLDSGATRRLSDTLTHNGISYGSQAATVVRLVVAWRAGVGEDRVKLRSLITRDDEVAFALQHGEALIDAVKKGRVIKQAINANANSFGAFAFEVVDRGRSEELDLFLGGLASGAGLQTGDARLALRNWFANATTATRRPSATQVLMTVAKTWNHWIEGRGILQVKPWKAGLPVVDLVA